MKLENFEKAREYVESIKRLEEHVEKIRNARSNKSIGTTLRLYCVNNEIAILRPELFDKEGFLDAYVRSVDEKIRFYRSELEKL